MVGSGDGNVSLIRDSTVTAKGNKQGRHKAVNSGVSTTVKEPTEPCLTEVIIQTCLEQFKFTNLSKLIRIRFKLHTYFQFLDTI